MTITYQDAGVNVEHTNEVLNQAQSAIQSTHDAKVLPYPGSYASFYDLQQVLTSFARPVLVQSVDGVGSKTKLARQLNKLQGLGQDLVSACCNDIAVMGAQPLMMLDYIAADHFDKSSLHTVLTSLAETCRYHGIALTGGESAEMPTVYRSNQLDLVGMVTGMIDYERIIDGQQVQPGHIIYGISSSGLHTNGYTLADKLLQDYDLSQPIFQNDPRTLGDILLEPHLNYTPLIQTLLAQTDVISAMAHITGGGLIDNLPRLLPANCQAQIQLDSWQPSPIFKLLQRLAGINSREALRTFNMGIGLVIIATDSFEPHLQQILTTKQDYYKIGRIISGDAQIVQLN